MANNAAQRFDEMARQAQMQTPTQQFDQVFKQIGQYTTGLSSEYNGIAAPPVQLKAGTPGGFGGFLQKITGIATQTGGIAKQIGSAALNFVGNSAKDIYKSTSGTLETITRLPVEIIRSNIDSYRSEEINIKRRQLSRDYGAGKLSKKDYKVQLDALNKESEDVMKSVQKTLDWTNKKTVAERNKEILDTTVNILSFGSLGLAEVGGKQALKAGGKEALDALMTQSATKLESIMLKNPAMRSLVTRNLEAMAAREAKTMAGQSAWQFVQMNGKKLAVDLLIKRPVFYQSNIGQAESLYKNLLEGDYKGAATDAAWLGVQAVNGGPLGKAKDIAGYTKSAVAKFAKGKGSVLDELSKQIGTKDFRQFGEYIANNPAAKKAAQVLQDTNLFVTRGDAKRAADNILLSYSHLDPTSITPEQIIKDITNHRDAYEILENAKKAGILDNLKEVKDNLIPVRWDAATRTSVADAVRRSAATGEINKDAATKAIHAIGDKLGFTNNFSLSTQLEKIIANSKTANEAADAIQAIDAAVGTAKYLPKPLQKQLAKLGYVLAEPAGGVKNKFIETEDLTKLISSAIKDPNLFDPSAAPTPVVSHIAGFLERFGISPQDSNGLASKKLAESVATRLSGTMAGRELGFNVDGKKAIGGDVVLSRLQQYIENKPGIHGLSKISAGQSSLTDIRQMTVNEIRQALATTTKGGTTMISTEAAKEIRQAIIKGFTDLPLEARGLADKLVDTAYAINPMQKYYARIQSALRYTYNPFFRAQESAETKILSKVQASNLIWMKPKEYAGSARQWLDDGAKILEETGIFKGQLPGEAAGDVTLGRITANLTKGQKRDLAGLAYDIAKSRGVELRQLANESPEILDDALRAIVQYPNKGVLASPLARTLNLAFFPMRYNAKVTMLAAKAIEKQPPAIQKAVLHSMFTMKDWMKSDEGIAWQSKNADAIALFKWITPVNSIEGTMKLLTGSINSPADLGQLGGLPFGLISQMLDSQGIISLNTPYVDPKTGSVFPKNIPKSVKARAAVALTDLLNSTFTYPGRTLGLPGKNQAIKDLVKNFIDTNGTDFESKIQTDKLTPLQEKWIEMLKDGGNSQDLIDELYQTPANGQFNGYTLPPLDLPFNPTFDASSEYKAPKMSKTLAKGKKQKVLAPTVKQPL